ncbi:MAG: GNAT family N-acetyltransferase [Acidimicrobiia bacterium]
MTFHYFAYGSNLWPPQLRSRCPSAREVGSAVLKGWAPVYDKPSTDGSAKLSIVEEEGARVHGALYEIDEAERSALDHAEPGYQPVLVNVTRASGESSDALTYHWAGDPVSRAPYDWYLSMVLMGAHHNGLPDDYVANDLAVVPKKDPLAEDIRPAISDDVLVMQQVLASAVAADGNRFSVHPGDLAWWLFHGDPRYPDHLTFWLQGDRGVLVIDSREPGINAFSVPGQPVTPLIDWAQRRLGDAGEVGWVSDDDEEFVSYLDSRGYEPAATDRSYGWDLSTIEVPASRLPDGWVLRHVEGEHESNNRHEASHAAFKSTMDPEMHHERYLGFMRSPVYVAEQDLVAVSPDGRIASFMIWWPDKSGLAQIEPFGTHPDFQGRGIGTALMHHGLRMMKDAGMRMARVISEDSRSDATSFYESVGFDEIGRVRWWGFSNRKDQRFVKTVSSSADIKP